MRLGRPNSIFRDPTENPEQLTRHEDIKGSALYRILRSNQPQHRDWMLQRIQHQLYDRLIEKGKSNLKKQKSNREDKKQSCIFWSKDLLCSGPATGTVRLPMTKLDIHHKPCFKRKPRILEISQSPTATGSLLPPALPSISGWCHVIRSLRSSC